MVHPVLTESREQQLVLHRLIAALALPDGAGETGAVRGEAEGSRAAAVRWAGHRREIAARVVALGGHGTADLRRCGHGDGRARRRGLDDHLLTKAGSARESSLERLAARSGHDLPRLQARPAVSVLGLKDLVRLVLIYL